MVIINGTLHSIDGKVTAIWDANDDGFIRTDLNKGLSVVNNQGMCEVIMYPEIETALLTHAFLACILHSRAEIKPGTMKGKDM